MFTYESTDGTEIHVYEWVPDEPPRGIVQIAHGMGEHAARYADLAETLNQQGYVVYAGDHRGHGKSLAKEPGHLGPDGWNLLVADLAALSRMVKDKHPELPLVLVGHSLGSFASQQYILDHAELIRGVALSGTTALDVVFDNLVAPGEGGDVMEQFNAPFVPARTSFDWLSRDEEQVDRYIADPLCGFSLDEQGLGDMGAGSARMADPSGVPDDLPVYVFVGDRDPINAGLALSDLLVQRYKDAGLADVTYRTYPEARHEILNETNREEVKADLVAWIDRVMAR